MSNINEKMQSNFKSKIPLKKLNSFTNLELLKALDQGKLLEYQEYKGNTTYDTIKIEECTTYFYMSINGFLEVKGWGSYFHLSNPGQMLTKIFLDPSKWSISKFKINDYPWNSKFNKE